MTAGTYNLELYLLDYDKGGRSEQIQLSDANTKTVLSTQTVSNFSGGAYVIWTISGNVLITITRLSGANAVLSGLFFDPTTSGDLVVVGQGHAAGQGLPGWRGQTETTAPTESTQMGPVDPLLTLLPPPSSEVSTVYTAALSGTRTDTASWWYIDRTDAVDSLNSEIALWPGGTDPSIVTHEFVNDVAVELLSATKPRARLTW